MNEQKFHNKNSIFDIEKPAKRSIKETSEKSLEVANENFVSNTKKSFYLATSNIDTHFKATIGLVHGEYRRIVNICSGEMRNSNNNIEFGKKAFLSLVSSVKKTFSSEIINKIVESSKKSSSLSNIDKLIISESSKLVIVKDENEFMCQPSGINQSIENNQDCSSNDFQNKKIMLRAGDSSSSCTENRSTSKDINTSSYDNILNIF